MKYLITQRSFIDGNLVEPNTEYSGYAAPGVHWKPLDDEAKEAYNDASKSHSSGDPRPSPWVFTTGNEAPVDPAREALELAQEPEAVADSPVEPVAPETVEPSDTNALLEE